MHTALLLILMTTTLVLKIMLALVELHRHGLKCICLTVFIIVVINEEVSYQSQDQNGVPQGSVLELLLFTLFMLVLEIH